MQRKWAYYNENDSFAAVWLRELIQANAIAPGEVDERDIREIQAEDVQGFTQYHFFAGIGVWSYALRAAGWPDDTAVWTGSCPCQSFSASGKRGGFSDQRHLWPAWFRLIGESRPDTIFGEQVGGKDGKTWFDLVASQLEGIDYAVGAAITGACGFGAPHIRKRLYFLAHSQRDGRRSDFARREAQGGAADGRDSATSGMAHAEWDSNRSQVQRDEGIGQDSTRPASRISGCGATDRLAYSTDSRRPSAGQHGSGPSPLSARPVECGGNGELGYSPQRGLGMRGSAPGERGRAAQPEQANELEHSLQPGLEGHDRDGDHGSESGRDRAAEIGSVAPPGFTNGFWSNAHWLWCRDQKYRPVEPAPLGLAAGLADSLGLMRLESGEEIFFPLITGAKNRVGRLRGYGNSLNAEQAIAFIESYMEVISGKSR